MFLKIASQKRAIKVLGVLLWVLSIHSNIFANALLLPRPLTGIGRTISSQQRDVYHSHQQLPKLKITAKDLNNSVNFASVNLGLMNRLETTLGWSDIRVKKGTPAHGQFIESSPEEAAVVQGKDALIATHVTMHLMSKFCHSHMSSCSKYIAAYTLHHTQLEQSCHDFEKSCSSHDFASKYRSIDGTCNHPSNGSLGASFSPYKRLLHAEYMDGVQEPRRAASKKLLPSPRAISSVMGDQIGGLDNELTAAVMQWLQFIEHDMVHTATSIMVHTKQPIDCCANSGGNLSPRYIHPFCAPISVPANDKYYSNYGIDCMTYVRSIPAMKPGCRLGPRDQMNQATHFMDGSQIYGTNLKSSRKLRSFTGGQLKTTKKNGKSYLPTSESPLEDCQLNTSTSSCFISGDSRVNTIPQLAAMHTLFLREHNRLAQTLATLNPSWNDEKVYQEARRIVIAEIQHITYNEWIMLILGKKYQHKIDGFHKYSDEINPSVSNSFATAAIRVFNSLISGNVKLYTENRALNRSLPLREHFNKPQIIQEPGYLDALVRGLATEPSQKMDLSFVDDVRNNLFWNGVYGFDVLSLDIQRGRDHGLPSYTTYRTLCGLKKVDSFSEFIDAIPQDTTRLLSEMYGHPDDVDLIVGGLAERPVSGSLFGPTLSCIVADQFLRTRRGDRYFYNNPKQPVPFTAPQLRQIQSVSLARIFCDNGDDIAIMQRNVFRPISQSNKLVDCDSKVIPKLDLSAWVEV